MLYAANTGEGAARVAELIPDCETFVIDSGRNVHHEKPSEFVVAIESVQK